MMSRDSSKSGWRGFLELTSQIQSTDELKEIFNLFFTLEEKEIFSSRFLIIRALLEERLTQREIADKYRVSIAQITRGSNALKIISPKIRNLLKNKLLS